MELINDTPFPGQFVIAPDKDGYETLVVVLKGTFAIRAGKTSPAEKQAPIVLADEFYGEPGKSSTKYESDLALYKPATDVVLIGHAYPAKKGAKESRVSLSVGHVSLAAAVTGDRHWAVTLGMARVRGPEPFAKIPLIFERSFGGMQPKQKSEEILGCEERNPVGTGYVRKRRRAFIDGRALPNIEHLKKRISRPGKKSLPVGFGFVGRSWLPRRKYLGTYDAAWQKNRMPLLPADFDERSFCGAPEALQASPHLRGNEMVAAGGVSAAGPFNFQLPGFRPSIEIHFEGKWQPLEPLLDTVVIEPDAERVLLTWRCRFRLHKKLRAFKAVRVKGAS